MPWPMATSTFALRIKMPEFTSAVLHALALYYTTVLTQDSCNIPTMINSPNSHDCILKVLNVYQNYQNCILQAE